jgi:hypothetical protein
MEISMGKVKQWLKNKLIDFLEIDKIIDLLDKHIDNNYSTFRQLDKDISHFQESVNILHNTVENVVHIGTDVRQTSKYNNERSWAVICVEGKLNLVKFVSPDMNNARELLQYLKQFEAGRHCIDAPNAELFYNELFKF